MKALVTGANGMLGNDLCAELALNNITVYATDIDKASSGIVYLDVADTYKIKSAIAEFRPDIVFHLAAETNVDKCEQETVHAYKVNTLGTENVALACLSYDIPMVYISTGSVFDGKKGAPYTEFDEPNPVNIYARTKWEGEKIVQKLLNRYYIIRAGWMIGGAKKDKKFVAKIVELLKTEKEIPVVTDKKGSPTFTRDFAKGIIELVSLERYGLYHMVNQGSCSRYEIAQKIVELTQKKGVTIKPITSDSFPLPAPRPDSEALENFKLNLLGICEMRSWQKALEDYIKILTKYEG